MISRGYYVRIYSGYKRFLEKYRIQIKDCCWYAGFTCIGQFIYQLYYVLIVGLLSEEDWVFYNLPFWLNGVLIFVPAFIIPPLCSITMMKAAIEEQHCINAPLSHCIKNCLVYIFIGELVRYVLCVIPQYYSNIFLGFGGTFSLPASLLFYGIYLPTQSRDVDMFGNGSIQLLDYAAYTVCHIVCLIPYILVVELIYCLLWRKYDKYMNTPRELDEKPIWK